MSNDPFRNYDSWLERPHQDAIDEADRFVEWAEERGFDLDDPADLKKAEDGYQDYLVGQHERRMISEYEDAMDRKYDEQREREWEND